MGHGSSTSNVEETPWRKWASVPGWPLLLSVSAGVSTFFLLWLFMVYSKYHQSKYGFLPSLNLGWETSLFRSNRCCAHYLLPSLYSFPISFPFSVPRRILILFIFSLSSIQSYALRKAGPTLRPSPDYSKAIIVAILGIGIGISIRHNSGQWDLKEVCLRASGHDFLS